MGIDIELDREVFTTLYVELLDAILSEKTEHALTGILSRDLNDIFLRHPWISCTV